MGIAAYVIRNAPGRKTTRATKSHDIPHPTADEWNSASTAQHAAGSLHTTPASVIIITRRRFGSEWTAGLYCELIYTGAIEISVCHISVVCSAWILNGTMILSVYCSWKQFSPHLTVLLNVCVAIRALLKHYSCSAMWIQCVLELERCITETFC